MQQTAYEMRISDWSSDVCSSDLRVVEHPAQRVACGPLAHPGEKPVVAHVGQALLEVGHAAQVHGGVEHAFDRTVDVFLVARRVGGLRGQDLDQVGEELHVCLVAIALERIEPGRPAVLQRQVVAAARPDRSEEHTSELQSLMRISYAVFCLKKKNRN